MVGLNDEEIAFLINKVLWLINKIQANILYEID